MQPLPKKWPANAEDQEKVPPLQDIIALLHYSNFICIFSVTPS